MFKKTHIKQSRLTWDRSYWGQEGVERRRRLLTSGKMTLNESPDLSYFGKSYYLKPVE